MVGPCGVGSVGEEGQETNSGEVGKFSQSRRAAAVGLEAERVREAGPSGLGGADGVKRRGGGAGEDRRK